MPALEKGLDDPMEAISQIALGLLDELDISSEALLERRAPDRRRERKERLGVTDPLHLGHLVDEKRGRKRRARSLREALGEPGLHRAEAGDLRDDHERDGLGDFHVRTVAAIDDAVVRPLVDRREPRGIAAMESVIAVLPALNEEETIRGVVENLPRDRLASIIVVDNGSTDLTASIARRAGARVVTQPERGYGAAILAGVGAALTDGAEVIVLLDADGSDPPELVSRLLDELEPGVDLVLGVRDVSLSERGSLTLQQRFGNALAIHSMRALCGARYGDLPPFKVIRRSALERLELSDRGYGLTIELLLRAHELGLVVREVRIPCRRRRGGASKVSGTLRGTLGAGVVILSAIVRHSALFRTANRRG